MSEPDNLFIVEYFEHWKEVKPPVWVTAVNKVLESLGFWVQLSLRRTPDMMTNREQRMNLYHLANQVLLMDVPGEFVELGCHHGQSAVLFQRILEQNGSSKKLHLFDSFQGLPQPEAQDGDTPFEEGALQTTIGDLLRNFRTRGLTEPTIHPGWFQDTLPQELPERIAFAHLDGDFYTSIMTSLEAVYPRLSCSAVCVIDDYYHGKGSSTEQDPLPGVKNACDDFFRDKPEELTVLYAGDYHHAYFRKCPQ